MFEMLSVIWAFVVLNYIPVILFYTLGGALYALIKWIIEIHKLARKVKNITEDDLKNKTLEEARKSLTSNSFSSYEYPPTAKNNKGLLTLWAVFWPLNLVWTLFSDVAKGIWDLLYSAFGAIFDLVAKKMLPK